MCDCVWLIVQFRLNNFHTKQIGNEGTVFRTRDDGSGKLVTGPAVHRPQVEDLGICPLGALIF